MAASRWSRRRGPTLIRLLRTGWRRWSTLGSLSDLLQACDLVADLAERRGVERGQAARKSPSKEDFHAACPAQSDARPGPGATGPGQGALPTEAVAAATALLAGVIAKAPRRPGREATADE